MLTFWFFQGATSRQQHNAGPNHNNMPYWRMDYSYKNKNLIKCVGLEVIQQQKDNKSW